MIHRRREGEYIRQGLNYNWDYNEKAGYWFQIILRLGKHKLHYRFRSRMKTIRSYSQI